MNETPQKRPILAGKSNRILLSFTADAYRLARKAHAGQFRRNGSTSYFDHCEEVASRVTGNEAIAVAYLHDTLEQTNLTVTEMIDVGLPDDVIQAVKTLTRGSAEHYFEYLARVKADPLATQVKIADLLSNLADTPTRAQILRYSEALIYLLDECP